MIISCIKSNKRKNIGLLRLKIKNLLLQYEIWLNGLPGGWSNWCIYSKQHRERILNDPSLQIHAATPDDPLLPVAHWNINYRLN